MKRLSDLFPDCGEELESEASAGTQSPADRILIGSSLFPDGPQTPKDFVMKERKKIQEMYREQGRDPDSLGKTTTKQRDYHFWMQYIDSLMVFERDEEALVHVQDLLFQYPGHHQLLEFRSLLEWRLGLQNDDPEEK